jgi:hypothetical protein
MKNNTVLESFAAIPRAWKNQEAETRIALCELNGHRYLDVRMWVLGSDDEFRPTATGITIRLGDIPAITGALVAAQRAVGASLDAARPLAQNDGRVLDAEEHSAPVAPTTPAKPPAKPAEEPEWLKKHYSRQQAKGRVVPLPRRPGSSSNDGGPEGGDAA